MLKLNIDNIGDLAIVECEGRIVHSEAAFKLRDAVTSQREARSVVLELSDVQGIEGGGLGSSCFCSDGLRITIFDSSCLIPPSPCVKGSNWSARSQNSTFPRSTK